MASSLRRAIQAPPAVLWENTVRRSLEEDLGTAGDVTTDAIVDPGHVAMGRVTTRAPGVVAGLPIAARAFEIADPKVEVEFLHSDGDSVEAESPIMTLSGPAAGVLIAERTALNFLGHLSGVATTTRCLVDAVAGTAARVVCTRKTTPGLRALEKYAVRAGGGSNHRFGLNDAVLIKDNHIAIAGSLEQAVQRVRERVGHMVKVEAEVDTLEQLGKALELGVEAVLLDNMSTDQLREAVSMCRGKAVTEASGGIQPDSARAIAETGVDLLSVGWLTHSAPALDIGLDLLSE